MLLEKESYYRLNKFMAWILTLGGNLMGYIDFVSELHQTTKRDYIGRVLQDDKAQCSTIAKQYGYDYWDGDRKYGYGGYHYDGRWKGDTEMVEKSKFKINGKIYEMDRILKDDINYLKVADLREAGFEINYDKANNLPVINSPKI